MSDSPLSPKITQTTNRLGYGPLVQNSNRVSARVTINQTVTQDEVEQPPNSLGGANLTQTPNRVNAEITLAKDAYQLAKEQDPTIGTREEWIASLKGEPGDTLIYNPVKTNLTGDGVTTVFAINGAENITNPAAVTVTVDGHILEPGVDYLVAGGQITFTAPLADGAEAVVISVSDVSTTLGESWPGLVDSWTEEPTLNAAIAGGEVYNYVYGAVTYYRFVPDPYVAEDDAFYASFANPVLSGLIARRGQPVV